MKWLENRSSKDRRKGENSRKNKTLSWRQEALGTENGVLLKPSSPTVESEHCLKCLSRAYVGKQRQRKKFPFRVPTFAFISISSFDRGNIGPRSQFHVHLEESFGPNSKINKFFQDTLYCIICGNFIHISGDFY